MDWLPWQDAVGAAGALGAASGALWWWARADHPASPGRRARLAGAALTWTRELTLMFGLYALWQVAGDHSLAHVGGAVARGREIARLERTWLPLPTEAAVQRLVLGDRTLLRLLDYYYADIHVLAVGAVLVWLFVRHRDRYPAVRNVLVGVTALSLLVALVPVAPPRLVPGLGLLDTQRVIGPRVYPDVPRPGLDQLSSFPSLHVGWALVVAGAVIYALHSRWRWLAAAYPLFTTWVVIVTGNHYWADGLAEVVIAGAALAVVAGAGRLAPSPAAPSGTYRRVTPARPLGLSRRR